MNAIRFSRFALAVLLIIALGAAAFAAPPRQQAQQASSSRLTPAQQQAREALMKRRAQMLELEKKIKALQDELRAVRNEGAAVRHASDIKAKKEDDALIEKLATDAGLKYAKTSYPSPVDGMTIPAYVFRPMMPRGPKGHPALVWVHGGVHSNFGSGSLPFIHEAVDRGYVVIAMDYRGSTGYGAEFFEAIDYGGYEVEDAMAAADYLKANVPEVDPERIGMIGWSHGGFITLHTLIRDQGKVFKCGYAGVPVTNLVFRLSYKGPSYEEQFSVQKRIGGEVYQKRDIYIERSPVYHVDKIKVPVRVHVATNDQDVNFVEDQMMIYALEYHLPRLAETKIYVDPPGGHSFERLVNKEKTVPQNTPAQRDGWNLIWAFLEEHLQPYR
jgi:dipeptidyl aminopeptidase/acylaminoacyl peptidase